MSLSLLFWTGHTCGSGQTAGTIEQHSVLVRAEVKGVIAEGTVTSLGPVAQEAA